MSENRLLYTAKNVIIRTYDELVRKGVFKATKAARARDEADERAYAVDGGKR